MIRIHGTITLLARLVLAIGIVVSGAAAAPSAPSERTTELQRALDRDLAGWMLSNVYLTEQLVVLPASLIWLYRRSPRIYGQLRNTVVVAWLVAMPIFALFPVAPPRLAGIGLTDTVSRSAAVALTGHSTIFYNPYAAVPSLHVGLAFAIGAAVQATLHARWARTLALLTIFFW